MSHSFVTEILISVIQIFEEKKLS